MGPGLEVESTLLPEAMVEVVLPPNPLDDPMVEPEDPLFELVVLTMPAREFKLARLVFPSRLATAAPRDVAANWLFGS